MIHLVGAPVASVSDAGVPPINLWNESAKPFDISPNEGIVSVDGQEEPDTHATFTGVAFVAGVPAAPGCGSVAPSVNFWNESAISLVALPNELDVVAGAQPGQDGFAVTICDTAIWASGAAMQPLRPRANVQARIDRPGGQHFENIKQFLGR